MGKSKSNVDQLNALPGNLSALIAGGGASADAALVQRAVTVAATTDMQLVQIEGSGLLLVSVQSTGGAAADLINDMKALYPDKSFCSNRGFSILDRIIGSCSYVMFESFLTDYNWEKGVYGKIGEDAAAWNDEITKQLFRLRRDHVFDVLALNYCDNKPIGDELREYIRQESMKRGWLSWSSEILLNMPLPNTAFTDSKGPIRSNAWRPYRVKRK